MSNGDTKGKWDIRCILTGVASTFPSCYFDPWHNHLSIIWTNDGYFTDAYMRHSASMSYNLCVVCKQCESNKHIPLNDMRYITTCHESNICRLVLVRTNCLHSRLRKQVSSSSVGDVEYIKKHNTTGKLTHRSRHSYVWHFAHEISKCIFANESRCILIQMSVNCVPVGEFDNKSLFFRVMTWRQTGDRPLPEPMMTKFGVKLYWICIKIRLFK